MERTRRRWKGRRRSRSRRAPSRASTAGRKLVRACLSCLLSAWTKQKDQRFGVDPLVILLRASQICYRRRLFCMYIRTLCQPSQPPALFIWFDTSIWQVTQLRFLSPFTFNLVLALGLCVTSNDLIPNAACAYISAAPKRHLLL